MCAICVLPHPALGQQLLVGGASTLKHTEFSVNLIDTASLKAAATLLDILNDRERVAVEANPLRIVSSCELPVDSLMTFFRTCPNSKAVWNPGPFLSSALRTPPRARCPERAILTYSDLLHRFLDLFNLDFAEALDLE